MVLYAIDKFWLFFGFDKAIGGRIFPANENDLHSQ